LLESRAGHEGIKLFGLKIARNRTVISIEWYASDKSIIQIDTLVSHETTLNNKKAYFASDQHFERQRPELSAPRERCRFI
jgi:hypothetical protein